MTGHWFYAHDDKKIGPYSDRQLRDLADAGHILRTDTVWREGTEQGVCAVRVKNLFSHCETALPAAGVNVPKTAVRLSPQLLVSALPSGTLQQAARPDVSTAALEPGPKPAESSAREMPKESTPTPSATPGAHAVSVAAAEAESRQLECGPIFTRPPVAPPQHAKKGRAVAGKGAIIVGQDGGCVKLIKKCTTCGHQDSSRTSVPIRNGLNKVVFFCRKCRKRRDVEFQGFGCTTQ